MPVTGSTSTCTPCWNRVGLVMAVSPAASALMLPLLFSAGADEDECDKAADAASDDSSVDALDVSLYWRHVPPVQ